MSVAQIETLAMILIGCALVIVLFGRRR